MKYLDPVQFVFLFLLRSEGIMDSEAFLIFDLRDLNKELSEELSKFFEKPGLNTLR